MKKSLFSLLLLFTFSSIIIGQEDPKKALSKAGRALGAYNLDRAGNEDKLHEAKEMIEIAAASSETNGDHKTWQTRGEIYNSYSDIDMLALANAENVQYELKYPDASLKAAESFEKSLSTAEKKYETKEAVEGLLEAGKKMNQTGNYFIQANDYAKAFTPLNKVMAVNKLLKENESDPIVKDEELTNHKFVVAFCAQAAKEKTVAKQIFKELYDAGSEEPSVYAQYYNILSEEGSTDAADVLSKGRKKFPENSELLFAKINDLIKKGENSQLQTVLEEAIKVEPNNPTVRLASGNVCMNLFNEEYKKNGNSEVASDYFNKSLGYFNQALEIDPNMFDASYSIGSLYFNKAVEVIKVANDLPLKEVKKYDAMTAEANGLMEKALPFFQKSESMNPNDTNTLIALGEIYARMNDFEKSTEFKRRLSVVKESGKNTSYFKQ